MRRPDTGTGKVIREAGGSGSAGFSDLSDLQTLPYRGLAGGDRPAGPRPGHYRRHWRGSDPREYHDEYERANKELARIGVRGREVPRRGGMTGWSHRPDDAGVRRGNPQRPFPAQDRRPSCRRGVDREVRPPRHRGVRLRLQDVHHLHRCSPHPWGSFEGVTVRALHRLRPGLPR